MNMGWSGLLTLLSWHVRGTSWRSARSGTSDKVINGYNVNHNLRGKVKDTKHNYNLQIQCPSVKVIEVYKIIQTCQVHRMNWKAWFEVLTRWRPKKTKNERWILKNGRESLRNYSRKRYGSASAWIFFTELIFLSNFERERSD